MEKLLWFFIVALCFIHISSRPVFSSNEPSEGSSVCSYGEESAARGVVTKSVAQPKKELTTDTTLRNRRKREAHPYQQPPKFTGKQFTLKVEANAYCLRGFTSRGVPTRTGVVAVDPKVIPYGSKLYIPGYGWGTALDTGGAMRGNVIDIWMPTNSQCMSWGKKQITITVVTP